MFLPPLNWYLFRATSVRVLVRVRVFVRVRVRVRVLVRVRVYIPSGSCGSLVRGSKTRFLSY